MSVTVGMSLQEKLGLQIILTISQEETDKTEINIEKEITTRQL